MSPVPVPQVALIMKWGVLASLCAFILSKLLIMSDFNVLAAEISFNIAVLVLLATPIARVVFFFTYYYRSRDWEAFFSSLGVLFTVLVALLVAWNKMS